MRTCKSEIKDFTSSTFSLFEMGRILGILNFQARLESIIIISNGSS
jgi:hypothetical protein